MSFVSKPEGGSEGGGPRGRQDYDRSKNAYPQRATLPRSQLSPQTRPAGSKDEEEYEGFSIISTEPLAAYQENRKTRFSPDHKQSRVGTSGGKVLVSSKGSISTPNSPVKMTLIPSPNSPFQKVGKLASSDTGESDQSSTETDSTVKSQEESNPKLDPQELAQKILEETQSHLIAVERLRGAVGKARVLILKMVSPCPMVLLSSERQRRVHSAGLPSPTRRVSHHQLLANQSPQPEALPCPR